MTVYAVLRVATRSLVFAGDGARWLVLMSGTIATLYRSTQFPSTGFLRFGVPWLLVCALVLAYRRDRPARVPLLIAYALVGVGSYLERRDRLLQRSRRSSSASSAIAATRASGARTCAAPSGALVGAGAAAR